MKIDTVSLRQLKIPLVSPFETSRWREELKTCVIVELRAGSVSGWGECAVSKGPWYSYETLSSAWHIMEEFLIPQIVGKDLQSPQQLVDAFSSVRGHYMAKASFEMAFWDLLCKNEGKSLSSKLGGTRPKIASGVSVGIQPSIDQLLDVVEKFMDKGYRRIKVKIKPGQDLELVSALREEFPDTPLMVDANGSYKCNGDGNPCSVGRIRAAYA